MQGQLVVKHEDDGYLVRYDGKYADRLTFDEAFGLVASIMMPEHRPFHSWLKTVSQHDAWTKKVYGMTEIEARVRSL